MGLIFSSAFLACLAPFRFFLVSKRIKSIQSMQFQRLTRTVAKPLTFGGWSAAAECAEAATR
jgi:hypothetical protein